MDNEELPYNVNLCRICQCLSTEPSSLTDISVSSDYWDTLKNLFEDIVWVEDSLRSLACKLCVKSINDIATFKSLCRETNYQRLCLQLNHNNVNVVQVKKKLSDKEIKRLCDKEMKKLCDKEIKKLCNKQMKKLKDIAAPKAAILPQWPTSLRVYGKVRPAVKVKENINDVEEITKPSTEGSDLEKTEAVVNDSQQAKEDITPDWPTVKIKEEISTHEEIQNVNDCSSDLPSVEIKDNSSEIPSSIPQQPVEIQNVNDSTPVLAKLPKLQYPVLKVKKIIPGTKKTKKVQNDLRKFAILSLWPRHKVEQELISLKRNKDANSSLSTLPSEHSVKILSTELPAKKKCDKIATLPINTQLPVYKKLKNVAILPKQPAKKMNVQLLANKRTKNVAILPKLPIKNNNINNESLDKLLGIPTKVTVLNSPEMFKLQEAIAKAREEAKVKAIEEARINVQKQSIIKAFEKFTKTQAVEKTNNANNMSPDKESNTDSNIKVLTVGDSFRLDKEIMVQITDSNVNIADASSSQNDRLNMKRKREENLEETIVRTYQSDVKMTEASCSQSDTLKVKRRRKENLAEIVRDNTNNEPCEVFTEYTEYLPKPTLKIHQCNMCNKKFQQLDFLERHKYNEHKGIRGYPCNICGRSYVTNSDLIVHSESHALEPYACPICPNKRFGTVESLKLHNIMLNHDNKMCEIKKYMPTIEALLLSRARPMVKLPLSQEKVKPKKKGPAKLQVKKTYKTKSVQANPKKIAQDVIKIAKCLEQEPSKCGNKKAKAKGQRDFKCHICNALFYKRSGLDRHMKKHRFKCRLCDQHFFKPTYVVKKHLKAHHGIDIENTVIDVNDYYCKVEKADLISNKTATLQVTDENITSNETCLEQATEDSKKNSLKNVEDADNTQLETFFEKIKHSDDVEKMDEDSTEETGFKNVENLKQVVETCLEELKEASNAQKTCLVKTEDSRLNETCSESTKDSIQVRTYFENSENSDKIEKLNEKLDSKDCSLENIEESRLNENCLENVKDSIQVGTQNKEYSDKIERLKKEKDCKDSSLENVGDSRQNENCLENLKDSDELEVCLEKNQKDADQFKNCLEESKSKTCCMKNIEASRQLETCLEKMEESVVKARF